MGVVLRLGGGRGAVTPAPGTRGFIRAMVAAQVGVQIGAFTLPALLPGFMERWALTNTQAGWLVGIFFAAYVPAVPVLLALTDRMAPRRIYLAGAGLTLLSHLGFALWADGFWSALVLRAVAGVGWAACYMPGLKALTDPLEGAAQSRAVSWHAAGVGFAGAMSFACAGLFDAVAGPAAAFLFAAIMAGLAVVIAAWVLPHARPADEALVPPRRLLDFRPVLRNRQAMGWIVGYTVHTWEMAALRAWAVTFLVATQLRLGGPEWLPGAAVLFTLAGFLGIAVSVTGNEMAQKRGRGRVVLWAMLAAAALSLLTGWVSGVSLLLAVLLVLLWNAAIYLDSSALTAGTVQAADKSMRGATMGLHSMAGYAGGFLGPLGVGLMLDLGGEGALGWGLAFGHLAVVTLAGLFVLRRLARGA
jgi:MFS family permease